MVKVGQDFGNTFLLISVLIIIGISFFFLMPWEAEIKKCADLMNSTDCIELNQYYLSCPETWERFNDQNCTLLNVSQYGVIKND